LAPFLCGRASRISAISAGTSVSAPTSSISPAQLAAELAGHSGGDGLLDHREPGADLGLLQLPDLLENAVEVSAGRAGRAHRVA
jgi:hypothetical protein